MPRKKIVFVIVEGPSDETALGAILNRIYDANSVYVHIMHCDITTELGVNSGNIVSRIGDIVRHYADNNHFRKDDFRDIIHIVDMDGAFIPNDCILDEPVATKPRYSPTVIHTCNKPGIENRNRQKRENLNRLISTGKIWTVPYRIFYMSCNLDHVLYDKPNSSDDDKENDAYRFAKKYRRDIPAFHKFISESGFSVNGSYSASWEFIRQDLHSLERWSNLGLCFNESEESDVQQN